MKVLELIAASLRGLLGSRAALMAENLALRQRLAVVSPKNRVESDDDDSVRKCQYRAQWRLGDGWPYLGERQVP